MAHILYKLLPRATANNLNEKASLYEGHGFSRAVNRLCLTASAAEVRFCETHRFAVSLEVLRHPLKALMNPPVRTFIRTL